MVKGGLIILTLPLNPNLDNCGPWQKGHKSPIYNLKDKKICLINRGNRGKPHGKKNPQNKQKQKL